MSTVAIKLDDLEYLVGMIEPNEIYDESKNPGLAAVMLRAVNTMVDAGSTARLGYPAVGIRKLQEYLQHHAKQRELDDDREKLGLSTVGPVVPERWK